MFPPAPATFVNSWQEIVRLECKPAFTDALDMTGRGIKAANSKRRIKLLSDGTVEVVDETDTPMRLKQDKNYCEVQGKKGWFDINLRKWDFKFPRGRPSALFRIIVTNGTATQKHASDWFTVNARRPAGEPPTPVLVLEPLPDMSIADALKVALPDHTKTSEWATTKLGGVETLDHLRFKLDVASFTRVMNKCEPILQSAVRALRACPRAIPSIAGQAIEEQTDCQESKSERRSKRTAVPDRENVHPNVRRRSTTQAFILPPSVDAKKVLVDAESFFRKGDSSS